MNYTISKIVIILILVYNSNLYSQVRIDTLEQNKKLVCKVLKTIRKSLLVDLTGHYEQGLILSLNYSVLIDKKEYSSSDFIDEVYFKKGYLISNLNKLLKNKTEYKLIIVKYKWQYNDESLQLIGL